MFHNFPMKAHKIKQQTTFPKSTILMPNKFLRWWNFWWRDSFGKILENVKNYRESCWMMKSSEILEIYKKSWETSSEFKQKNIENPCRQFNHFIARKILSNQYKQFLRQKNWKKVKSSCKSHTPFGNRFPTLELVWLKRLFKTILNDFLLNKLYAHVCLIGLKKISNTLFFSLEKHQIWWFFLKCRYDRGWRSHLLFRSHLISFTLFFCLLLILLC